MFDRHCFAVCCVFTGIQYCAGFNVLQQRSPASRVPSSSSNNGPHETTRALSYSVGDGAELATERPTTTTTTTTSTLPFRSSIAGSDAELTFQSFWEWHASFMSANLPGLERLDCSSRDSVVYGDRESDTGADFSYAESPEKKARIHNRCHASDDFRKIRTTYYDGGRRCQVFNALWYPRYGDVDAPVLGIDLLAFGKGNGGDGNDSKRYLVVVDFQPVVEEKSSARPSYERDVMAPVRNRYPSLHGKMTDRFYDEERFFSKQMLYGRYEDDDEEAVARLFPAFSEYVEAYVGLIRRSNRNQRSSSAAAAAVERQTAYDNYSARRDPALKMFQSVFGRTWAEEFVHGFLFSLSSLEDAEEGNTVDGRRRRRSAQKASK